VTITIRGDFSDTDLGVGTSILLEGTFQAPLIEVYGENDADQIIYTPVSVIGHTQIWGAGGDDYILVDLLPTIDLAHKFTGDTGPASIVTGNELPRLRNMVDLDGQGAADRYEINTTGSSDYIVNVHDSGAPADGADRLTINGTTGNDVFLVRRFFIARMQPIGPGLNDFADEYERINYDRTMNVVHVNSGSGEDRFYADDNSAITILDGGEGDDFIQFGQMFGAARTSPDRVALGDEIETVETTVGFLSRGISFPTTAYGGDGEDKFVVFSNKAPLKLFGEAGNDEFVVRAFVIKNTTIITTNDTLVSGGAGNDHIEYNINAPVSIDGGEGVDTVVVIGTEVADNFVITRDSVKGAGLNVHFTTVERLEVDGMEGDDHFFILSTHPKVITTIIGGLGSDTFDVGGDVTSPIIALSIEGESGFINHSLSSDDPDYDGIFAEGVQLNIAGATTGTVVVTPSGGSSVAVENGGADETDTYTLRLAVAAPSTPTIAYLTVAAAPSPSKDRSAGGGSLQVASDGVNFVDALVLTFDSNALATDPNAWARTQTITVRAVADTAEEGERTVVVSHSVESANPDFDRLNVVNVEVKVIDDDKAGLIVTQTSIDTSVIEGGATDTYTVALTRAPAADEIVTATLDVDTTQLTISAYDASQSGRFDASNHKITFDGSTWNVPFVAQVAAVDDSVVENRLLTTLVHMISSSLTSGVFSAVVEEPEVDVDVRDNDAGGLLVIQSDGSTLVSDGHPDTYTLQLTKAPSSDVTVSILTDGKTIVSAYDSADTRFFEPTGDEVPTVVFSASNWNTPFIVEVTVNPEAPTNGSNQPEQTFSAQPHVMANVFGPLIIEGSQTKERTITPGVRLPTETDVSLPVLSISVDETQMTDTLNIFNDGSLANDTGGHGFISATHAHAIAAIYDVASLESTDFGHVSGLGMGGPLTLDFGTPSVPDERTFDAGITYHDVEVVDVLLGRGDDIFTVDATVSDVITVVQGGGGNDMIFVNDGGGAESPLIVFGDTSQDGMLYDSTTAIITGRGREFPNPGDDFIDASEATLLIAIYGGPGNDTIYGSQAGDHIAGGSGNDTIYGQGGGDHIYGDSGFNIDMSERLSLSTEILTVVTAPEVDDNLETFDDLSAGADEIHGEGDDDIIFGDLGVVEQSTQKILSTGNVFEIQSESLDNGNADTISGEAGADIILGGGAGDVIFGDDANASSAMSDGEDILLGDNGTIILSVGVTGRLNLANSGVEKIETTDTDEVTGGADTISGNAQTDVILGGVGGDTIYGDAVTEAAYDNADVILGDNGFINFVGESTADPSTLELIQTLDVHLGGVDTIHGNDGDDIILGGKDGDTIHGNAHDDIVLGDFGQLIFVGPAIPSIEETYDKVFFNSIARVAEITDNEEGGGDTIYGDADEDILIGGAGSDTIDGDADDDLIFGDNVRLTRDGSAYVDDTNPRFRTLTGTKIYDENDNALVDNQAQGIPSDTGTPVWADWEITLLDHSMAVETAGLNNFGDDYIAGGPDDDTIFGQLGNDTIQGDGSIGSLVNEGSPVTAYRDTNGLLVVVPSFENLSDDGDDYIEGNGGNDVIFGNLGQDDILGGSSDLFSLITPDLRPDGSDLIFGGAGTDITRNNGGDESPNGHARDADMILGDNGNIFRLVMADGVGTSDYLTFSYDNYNTLKIIPRAAVLLDYHVGGPDYDPTTTQAANDIGVSDEIHGESGDDFIYGMKGDDILFGEGQDDDIIGGYDNDWISGGTGNDGVLGDDGRIYTSRNGIAEPLYGIGDLADELNMIISTPGKIQQATINVTGELKKTVNLTPFKLGDPDAIDYATQDPLYADDIIYGGWGGDFLHGGAGDDAISGAEALPMYYDAPHNPGDILKFGVDRAGEFGAYDEYDPWSKVYWNPATGEFVTGGSVEFLLNFDHDEGPNDPYSAAAGFDPVATDGDDVIFGDLGNDWLVGGTGKDHLYGGYGYDLLNVDDDHITNGEANDMPDTHPSYEDIAYGGAGRDYLIANTGGDRLIDWAGEFNSYIVPFAPFGMATVSRTLQPQIMEYLYALSASDGADPTRAADTGADPLRNGEPEGELGLVKQKDFDWHDQTGAPDDPQPGNIAGGKRDVLRSATFNAGTMEGFFTDSGVWNVENGALKVSAESLGGDAASVFHVDEMLPSYFEIQATITMEKPTGGWKANSYIIFDYYSPTDFKFAGLNASIDKIQMGHRTSEGWIVDVQSNLKVKPGNFYDVLVAINGTTVTVLANNEEFFSHTFEPRVIDDWIYGINSGMVGFGSDNSRGVYDNIAVQILPPEITFEGTEDFPDTVTEMDLVPVYGNWVISGDPVEGYRYDGTLAVDVDRAVSLVDLGLSNNLEVTSFLGLETTLNTDSIGGLVFDYYKPDHFKYAAIDAVADTAIIGHYTEKSGWVTDATFAIDMQSGVDYVLALSLKGTTVSLSVKEAGLQNWQAMVGHVFNAVTVDGDFGLLTRTASSSFDAVTAKTDDPAFTPPDEGDPLEAAYAPLQHTTDDPIQSEDLEAVASEAIERWSAAIPGDDGLKVLESVIFDVADLRGLRLGKAVGTTIYIDSTAAGHGWSLDIASSPVIGRVDLLTVLMHELGHVLGLDHAAPGESNQDLMNSTLSTGVRLVPMRDDVATVETPVSDSSPSQPSKTVHLEPSYSNSFATWVSGMEYGLLNGRHRDRILGAVHAGVSTALHKLQYLNNVQHIGRWLIQLKHHGYQRTVADPLAQVARLHGGNPLSIYIRRDCFLDELDNFIARSIKQSYT
jgi:Ca2+-binding RTX toxin-like protein